MSSSPSHAYADAVARAGLLATPTSSAMAPLSVHLVAGGGPRAVELALEHGARVVSRSRVLAAAVFDDGEVTVVCRHWPALQVATVVAAQVLRWDGELAAGVPVSGVGRLAGRRPGSWLALCAGLLDATLPLGASLDDVLPAMTEQAGVLFDDAPFGQPPRPDDRVTETLGVLLAGEFVAETGRDPVWVSRVAGPYLGAMVAVAAERADLLVAARALEAR